jgi:Protein of unknown function (DUF3752)
MMNAPRAPLPPAKDITQSSVDAYNHKHRPKSLMEIHQEQLDAANKSARKEAKKQAKLGAVPAPAPFSFNRETDMDVRRSVDVSKFSQAVSDAVSDKFFKSTFQK